MRGPRSFDGRWPGRTVLGRPLPLLLVFTAIGLAARVFRLGARVAHQDEARVAHWILHYMAVGRWEYRAIIHGPFLPHVNGVVFDLLGPSDFSMRLIVAVIGGLLPLSAWLLRDRLRSTEVVFLGAILALNPVLLYYSRFMRNDLLLAAMAFTAFALAVRAIDTGQARYLLAAGLVFGLGATTKENALLYPLAWGGALVLLLDHRLFIARYTDESWRAVGKRWLGRGVRSLWSWRHPIVGSVVLMAVVVVAFYAPKPDLYRALGNPARLPGVLDAATLGTWEKFTDLWASAGMQKHSYPRFL
ncbi:MAG: flippase activity-associated protein Agl23, partial [Halodesulfurarchaeum sp.]